jgi:hypothetical protein
MPVAGRAVPRRQALRNTLRSGRASCALKEEDHQPDEALDRRFVSGAPGSSLYCVAGVGSQPMLSIDALVPISCTIQTSPTLCADPDAQARERLSNAVLLSAHCASLSYRARMVVPSEKQVRLDDRGQALVTPVLRPNECYPSKAAASIGIEPARVGRVERVTDVGRVAADSSKLCD